MDEREDEVERLRGALGWIEHWIDAYPETVFIPMTSDELRHAALVLHAHGISMDGMHAEWARQILDGIRTIVRSAQ